MKIQIFILFFLSIYLIGCVPNPKVRFLEPQPKESRDLKSFPRKFQGRYLSKTDSSILTINSKTIIQEWIGFARVSEVEMENELDTIYSENVEIELWNNWTMKIVVDGDSAIISTYGIDTLFQISEQSRLRKLKGYLFLNNQRSDLTWSVKTLKLEKRELDFTKLIKHTQIDSLIDITDIKIHTDSVSNRIDHYDLKPRKKELRELLKRKTYNSGFIKIK